MKKLAWSVVVAALLAGCGGSGSSHGPSLAGVPLVSGTRVVAHVRRCDSGASPYCAIQVVAVGPRYGGSQALLASERKYLHSIGWSAANADVGIEHAASSPGQKLRLTYATAALDLQAFDLGWIRRSPAIGRALSQTMFARQPALSLMLETGSS